MARQVKQSDHSDRLKTRNGLNNPFVIRKIESIPDQSLQQNLLHHR